ncbi:MAG: hypothetical protein ACE37J_12630 [Pikeienuella sp.]|uniref:hypothetical protein n=1 Tax=Pikeienuella sp. TaxID=2831957 RepID=UPI00391BD78D
MTKDRDMGPGRADWEAPLDAALAAARAAPPGPAPEGLLERIMADAADVAASRGKAEAAPRRPARSGALARLLAALPALRPAAACAAAALVGLWLGQTSMVAGAADALLDQGAGAVAYEDDPLSGALIAFGDVPEGW